jgi:hypothetical protein
LISIASICEGIAVFSHAGARAPSICSQLDLDAGTLHRVGRPIRNYPATTVV